MMRFWMVPVSSLGRKTCLTFTQSRSPLPAPMRLELFNPSGSWQVCKDIKDHNDPSLCEPSRQIPIPQTASTFRSAGLQLRCLDRLAFSSLLEQCKSNIQNYRPGEHSRKFAARPPSSSVILSLVLQRRPLPAHQGGP